MNRAARRILALLVLLAFTMFSGCASGRMRSDSRIRRDRIPAKQSSYRIRGTDETGILTASQQKKLRAQTYSWRWPTNQVTVTSNFGERGSHHHDGIDLRAASGTPIRAAGDGKVIYSGSKISGYGKMIVIRHSGKLSTIYAHNSRLQVKVGQKVRRGQLIALSGNTGHSSGPHLHFEVREGITAINPLLLLPSPKVANEANRRMLGQSDDSDEASSREKRRAPAREGRKSRDARRYSQSSAQRLTGPLAARVAEDDGFQPKSPRN